MVYNKQLNNFTDRLHLDGFSFMMKVILICNQDTVC